MSFSWNEYITLAEQLNKAEVLSFAKMRTATSRAYYGAFCLCRNKKGLSADKRPDIHNYIINMYKNSDDSTEYSISNYLDGLRRKRNHADYDGFYNPTWQETNNHIENAKSIVSLLASLP